MQGRPEDIYMTRIRKAHRNDASFRDVVTVQLPSGSLLRAWDFDGDVRPNSTTPEDVENENKTTTTMTTKVVSPSRQSPSVSKIVLLQREDHLRGLQADGEAEQATRHYVRRKNIFARKGDVAASAFSEGNEPIKQGESEELLSGDAKIAKMPPPASVASKSKLNRRQTEDNDKSHPSTAPEGSLLHTLYLQLLVAGSEGITLPELYTSFKTQTALPRFVSDWKAQVWFHLKNNPHIDQVKGHFLLRAQLVQQQPKLDATVSLNRLYMCVSPETANPSGRHVRTTAQSNDSPQEPAVQPLLLAKKEEGIQTRRKAYEKKVEAVLTESAMEFEKMQRNQGSTQMPSSSAASDFVTTDSQATTPLQASRKRKSSTENGEQDDRSKTFRGSLQAMRARILAETGELQEGVPCARKDDARRWRCPLTAMEGHTLCRHHKTLQLQKRMKMQETKTRRSAEAETKGDTPGRRANRSLKSDTVTMQGSTVAEEPEMSEDNVGGTHAVEPLVDLQSRRMVSFSTFEAVMEDPATTTSNKVHEEAESSKSKTPSDSEPLHRNIHAVERATPGSLKALQRRILAESGKQSGVQCARRDGGSNSSRKWQCPLNAKEGHNLCDHHFFLKEKKKARYAAMKTGLKDLNATSDMGLPKSYTQFNEVPASKSSEKDVEIHGSPDEKLESPSEYTDTDEDIRNVEIAKRKSKEDDELDSNAERVLPHMVKNAPKRRYVAAKKSAADVNGVKGNSQDQVTSPLIRPPTIPPLPAMYGVRRKAVKNRSLLLL